ncbi:MAG TPA: hypothetical protein VN641_20255 [Urbifossiella sp.]|nr:hypothetical protein [Urbifossiella sp.]
MRYPQLLVHDADGWVARQLAELAEESRWLLKEPKSRDAVLALVRDLRPTVLFLRVDPSDEKHPGLAILTDVLRSNPDAAIVAVSDVKLPDADRAAWTALLFDLGARYVLFPPLTGPILEDLASGLMAAAIRRVVGVESPPRPAESPIDLASEEAHA